MSKSKKSVKSQTTATLTAALAAGAQPLVKPAKGKKAPNAAATQSATQTPAPAPKTEPKSESKGEGLRVEHANGAAFTTQRPGVLAHIENLLRKASAEAPVSKSDIFASLVVAFPDREEAKMKTTLNMQVPSGFKIEKGFIIAKVEGKGYYFDSDATEAYQKDHEKRGGKWQPKKVAEASK